MLASEMIAQLANLIGEVGDREVLITDGIIGNGYRGNYSIGIFEDVDGRSYIDIGIGLCMEKPIDNQQD